MNEIVVGLGSVSIGTCCREMGGRASESRGQTLRAVYAIDVSPAFNMAVGMGRVPLPIKDYEMDIVYRKAVASVFDSIRPDPPGALQFFFGEAGRVRVTESVGPGWRRWARRSMWTSAGSAPVR
jgi:hypothetical protein